MILRRLSFVQLTLFSSILLLLLIFVFVTRNLMADIDAVRVAQQNTQLTQLLDALEKVAHNHAVERGLTAGFLGKPSAQAKAKVDEQRVKADAAVAHLDSVLSQEWDAHLNLAQKLSPLKNHLRQKPSVRSEIDQTIGKRAFQFYSTLNKLAIDTARNISIDITDPEVADSLNAALLLAGVKERLGQLRGKVNGTLARQSINAVVRTELESYARDKQILVEFLKVTLAPDQRTALLALDNSSENRTMTGVLASLRASEPDFGRLPTPSEWFPNATKLIGKYKALLDEQWSQVATTAKGKQVAAEASLATTLVLMLVGLGIALVVNVYLVRSLRRQLKALKIGLKRIADEGDLTVTIASDRQNELGEISRDVQSTIDALKELIANLEVSVVRGQGLSARLDNVSTEMLNDSELTQSMTHSISAAVEEMSQTSGDIAQSSVDTLDAAKTLDEHVSQSLSINSSMKQLIASLEQNMQKVRGKTTTMDAKVTEIAAILENINNLSEQTNLLALNAAIEAARAGEQGRGFAVVADEVRALAQASRKSSDQISVLLSNLQEVSNDVVKSVEVNVSSVADVHQSSEDTASIAHQIKDMTQRVEEMATTVAAGAEEQSSAARQVAEDIVRVNEVALNEKQSASELEAVVEETKDNYSNLNKKIERFKIG